MTKELQDLAWSVLPKEFKEEVKRVANIFSRRTSGMLGGERTLADTFLNEFINLFGRHNLTSDAEGEDEMLMCEKSKVQEQYALNVNALRKGNLTDMQTEIATKVKDTLYYLFGSKCLPDIEPKPAGPKFKVGDKVRISCAFSSGEIWDSVLNGRVATIVGCYRESNNWIYCFEEPIRDFAEFWLEPCAEQETLHCPSSETECYIPLRVPKMDEQRLNIATHITAAIYANYDVAKCFESIEAIVRKAVETADALIAGCKKE